MPSRGNQLLLQSWKLRSLLGRRLPARACRQEVKDDHSLELRGTRPHLDGHTRGFRGHAPCSFQFVQFIRVSGRCARSSRSRPKLSQRRCRETLPPHEVAPAEVTRRPAYGDYASKWSSGGSHKSSCSRYCRRASAYLRLAPQLSAHSERSKP